MELYKPNFKVGDIIEFCGEQFRVLTSGALQGTVEYLDGEYVGKMYWEYCGSKATLVKRVNIMDSYYDCYGNERCYVCHSKIEGGYCDCVAYEIQKENKLNVEDNKNDNI